MDFRVVDDGKNDSFCRRSGTDYFVFENYSIYPNYLMMNNWIQGQVVGKRCWASNLYSLQISADIQPFTAGQFTKLALDIDDQRVGRPYSFVNPPHQQPLEFYFITLPDGPLTTRLIKLESGDKIWIMQRASGFFTLSEVPDAENLWLLATGTALGVFLSILRTQDPWERFKKVILVHAVRTVDELTYQDEIKSLYTAHPQQFQMIPFVSREDTDFAIKDRIPVTIEDGRLESRAGIPLTAQTSQVMICGNPDMVRDTRIMLEQRGLKKNKRREPGQITVENYW